MKISTMTLGPLLLIFALNAKVANGSLILTHNQQQDGLVRTRTIDNLKTDPIAAGDNISGGAAGNTSMATGTVSAAAVLSDTESFTLTYTGVSNWDATAAQAAESGGTFQTYLNGLTAAEVHSTANGYGIASDSNLNTLGEALVITASTSNLANGLLILESIGFQNYTAGDRTDIAIFDVSANSFVAELYNASFNGSGDSFSGSFQLDDGDAIIVGVGATNGANTWRQNSLTFDVTPVPEPGSVLLFSLALVGGAFFKMRKSFRRVQE